MKRLPFFQAWLVAGLCVVAGVHAGETASVTLRVTGLFSSEREADLRRVVDGLDAVKIRKIDYDRAEVAFSYKTGQDPFIEADAEKVQKVIDNLLRNGSNHTFGALPPSGLPDEKLERIEIPVAGLDCKACSYGAYRAIYQIEGVVRATASFKTGLVTALVEPEKTNRTQLEEALKSRGVDVKEVPE